MLSQFQRQEKKEKEEGTVYWLLRTLTIIICLDWHPVSQSPLSCFFVSFVHFPSNGLSFFSYVSVRELYLLLVLTFCYLCCKYFVSSSYFSFCLLDLFFFLMQKFLINVTLKKKKHFKTRIVIATVDSLSICLSSYLFCVRITYQKENWGSLVHLEFFLLSVISQSRRLLRPEFQRDSLLSVPASTALSLFFSLVLWISCLIYLPLQEGSVGSLE